MMRFKSNRTEGRRLLVLALIGVVASACGLAQPCQAPTGEKQAQLSTYVAARYHFDSSAQLVLLESAPANDSCFWKLHYRSSSTKAEVTVYLSPDGKYIVPEVYDLSADPLSQERARAEQLMKTLVADDPPSIGSADAPITIVEFSDFECPYCKRMHDVLVRDLTADERKGIRLVFRQYPLAMHPWARSAAEIAGCAALQSDGAFWKVGDYLFDNQANLTVDNLRDSAMSFLTKDVGLDKTTLDKCMDKRLSSGGVTQDLELGNKNGVHATPTLFINGAKYDGAKDVDQLRGIIAEARNSEQARMARGAPVSVPGK